MEWRRVEPLPRHKYRVHLLLVVAFEVVERMSFSISTKLSERLTPAKTRELAGLIMKSEHPQPSVAVVTPLLELVRGRSGGFFSV